MGWIIALGIVMVFEWVAAGKSWIRVRRISKPLSLIILIAMFIALGGWRQPGYLFLGGLVFSLLGDISLQSFNFTFYMPLFDGDKTIGIKGSIVPD